MIRLSIVVVLLLFFSSAHSEQRLPAYLLQLPDSTRQVFIAETATSTLHRYVRGPNGLDLLDTSYMSVGQNGVGKVRAWDRRTPLGIYFINEQLDTNGLHDKYGVLAFPLDYPNVWDRLNNRSGDGIWIHGVDPDAGVRPQFDTDGCIALPNAELLVLSSGFVPLITPIIITTDIRWADSSELAATREELRRVLGTWVESYRSGDLHKYLALYAEDFTYRGLNKDEWSAYRLQTIGTRPVGGIEISDVLLLADPQDEDIILSRFRQTIIDASQVDRARTIVTTKRLYWQRAAGGEFQIIAEDNG